MTPKPHCYEFPRPSVTTDIALFSFDGAVVRVLLIKRDKPPFADCWALPGGFLELHEPAETGARRELLEETRIQTPWPLHPLGFYDAVQRDPRGRTISLVFVAPISPPFPAPTGADDAREACWLPIHPAPRLAFDHDTILADAVSWLSSAVQTGGVGLQLLPETFERDQANALFNALFGNARLAPSWLRRLQNQKLIRQSSPSNPRFKRLLKPRQPPATHS